MASFAPYLIFTNGNCREAMNFYKDALGGTLEISEWKDFPNAGKETKEEKKGVMHSTLTLDKSKGEGKNIMASDGCGECVTVQAGDDVAISVNFDSEESLRAAFDAMSAGGSIVSPVEKTFWGAFFGQMVDKFGKRWMFHHQISSEGNSNGNESPSKKQKVEEKQ